MLMAKAVQNRPQHQQAKGRDRDEGRYAVNAPDTQKMRFNVREVKGEREPCQGYRQQDAIPAPECPMIATGTPHRTA